MKPDFSIMSRTELRAYILAHREEEDAFFAYIDRSNHEATWVDCPPVESSEALQEFPLFLEKLQQDADS